MIHILQLVSTFQAKSKILSPSSSQLVKSIFLQVLFPRVQLSSKTSISTSICWLTVSVEDSGTKIVENTSLL